LTKPGPLTYGVDDIPPPVTLLVLSLQHLALISIFLIVAVTLARLAGLTPEEGIDLLAMTMVAGGIGAILQSFGRFGIGSGFLVPPTTTTILLPPAVAALAAGGLPAVMGMTIAAGAAVMVLSRVIHRMRAFFPPEIAGFVVLMVGLSVMQLAMRNFLGIGQPERVVIDTIWVAALSLALMIGLNVWGSPQLRFYGTLIGVVAGYVLAGGAGLIPSETIDAIAATPTFRVPHPGMSGLAFDTTLIVPYAVAAIALSLNTVGAVTAAQKINDAEWKRPSMRTIANGILAEGATNMVAGAIGGAGQSATSGAVGLSQATGATSRVIGHVVGALLILLAFLPQVASVLLAMPSAVIGAALTFSGSFIAAAGIQMIASRLLDARKIFVLGVALAFALARIAFPDHFDGAPDWLQPWVNSPVSLSVLIAVALNLVFRIGIFQRNALTIDSERLDRPQLIVFVAEQGALWGARPEVAHRAEFATIETIEALVANRHVHDDIRLGPHIGTVAIPGGLITLATRFDEFALTVEISYRGTLLEPRHDPPEEMTMLDTRRGGHEIARYMIQRAADIVTAQRHDDLCVVKLVIHN
jgi:NCS2 family nucleobase:cation symporter-2